MRLVSGAMFWQYVLALHIIAVIVSFGVLFIWPVLDLIGARLDDSARPWFHRAQLAIHLRIQAPGLVILLVAGIYLASKLDVWNQFFVQWGVAAVVVIGGIGGALIAPRERKLIALSGTQVAAAAGDPVTWSDDYATVKRQADTLRLVQLAIAVVTVVLMTVQA